MKHFAALPAPLSFLHPVVDTSSQFVLLRPFANLSTKKETRRKIEARDENATGLLDWQ
eukprot:COSAG06_NODE_338_length_17232_cov_73.406584_8_plen_58_part_00